jgi:hypothetical protein
MKLAAKIILGMAVAIAVAGERWDHENTLERDKQLAVFTAVTAEQRKSWAVMENMAPKQQVEDAIRRQREFASKAQEAIISEYIAVYCTDHRQESEAQKQVALYGASIVSKISIGAGVDRLALAEYSKCKGR